MISLELDRDEIGSLAYVQFGEIIASYRAAKPSDILKRLERCHVLVTKLASGGQENEPPKTRSIKRETMKIEFDELRDLIHDRLMSIRKVFYAKTYSAVASDLARIIELHREFVKASRLAAMGKVA